MFRKWQWTLLLVAATSTTMAAAAAAQNPYVPANKVTVTPAVVTQFATGLRAELAERDRLAAAAQTDANVKAFWRHRDARMRCDSAKAWQDAEAQRLAKVMQTTTNPAQITAAVGRIQTLAQASTKACTLPPDPQLEQAFFDNLRRAESGMDDVGARAAGLTRGQYAFLRERIAAVILGAGNGAYGVTVGYTPSELIAIRARAAGLKPMLLRDFTPTGDRKPSSDY
jgi:hypothetical protein